MCPWGSSLLLGNANGGVRRLQIGTDNQLPKLVEVSGQQQLKPTAKRELLCCGATQQQLDFRYLCRICSATATAPRQHQHCQTGLSCGTP